MQARAVVRDVARVMGLPYADGDKIAKLIPQELKISLTKAINSVPELKEFIQSRGDLQKLWNTRWCSKVLSASPACMRRGSLSHAIISSIIARCINRPIPTTSCASST